MSPGTEPRQSRSRSPSLRPIATRPMLPRLGKRHPRLREPEVDALRQAEEHRRFAKEENQQAEEQGQSRILPEERESDRKSTRLNSSHSCAYRMQSSACKK